MPQTCPDCGSSDSFSLVAEIGQEICSECGAISDELRFYEPTNRYEIAYALGIPTDGSLPPSTSNHVIGPAGGPYWTDCIEESRRRREFFRKPEVDARVQGTLNTLGYPGLFAQVDFLFKRARDASWKDRPTDQAVLETLGNADSRPDADSVVPSLASTGLPSSFVPRRVRWGNDSLLLATACCYVILRREGARIDLQTVSAAAHLPYTKVRRAFKLLRLLVRDVVRDIKLNNPDPYVRRIVAFFLHQTTDDRSNAQSVKLSTNVVKFLKLLQSDASPAESSSAATDPCRILTNTPFEAVETTALDLCAFWWPRRESYASNPQLAAFAAVVLAMEICTKTLAPVYEIFRYAYQALQYGITLGSQNSANAPVLTEDDPVSKHSVALYGQICSALRLEAAKVPWLKNLKPTSRKARPRSTVLGTTDLVRRDLVVHAHDVLDLWRATRHTNISDQGASGRNSKEKEPLLSRSTSLCAAKDNPSAFMIPADEEESESDVAESELDCFVLAASDTVQATGVKLEGEAGETSRLDQHEPEDVWTRLKDGICSATASSVGQSSSSTAHPIDLLSDDQVDRLLFDDKELSSIFRTDPAELAAFERIKVAAGDWPAVSAQQRNAEFIAFANSVSRDRTPKRKKAVKRSASATPSISKAIKQESGESRKRKKQSPASAHPQVKPKLAKAKSSQRIRVPSPVSLRQQLDESDWSD